MRKAIIIGVLLAMIAVYLVGFNNGKQSVVTAVECIERK